MTTVTPQLMHDLHLVLRCSIHICLHKALPDTFHCQVGWMQHILRIVAIVAQFVHHNLVGGEVGDRYVVSC